MTIRHLRAFVLKSAALALLAGTGMADTRPNVVFLLADDMGFSDLGCYGGEIDTPHLDSLADHGLRSTEFYNTARCWPTRATLMTGRYRSTLDDRPTIAETLRKAGYQTAMAGKWHLGAGPNSPFHRGFEDFYGTLGGAGSFWDPPELMRNDQTTEPASPDEYYTDRIGLEAVRQIRRFATSERPFFHYVAFTAPHWPLHAPEATIQKYADHYHDGWHALREKRYARMLEIGIIDKDRWPLAPREPRVRDWETMPDKAWHTRNMAIYAAMLDHLDQAVGKIIGALKETEQFENTLIIFCSDNGACAEHLEGDAWTTAGNVIEKARREGWKITVGDDPSVPNGGPHTFGSVGRDWAHAQNTPLPRYKANVRAGGALTPAIFHWPDRLPASARGTVSSQRGHVIDLMATLCELAGTPTPAHQGRSLLPMLTGGTLDDSFPYYFDHAGTRAVIRGRHKLVQENQAPWKLFDLAADKTETKDLAASHPQIVAELKALWQSQHPGPD